MIELCIGALITWRITYFLVNEDAPFQIMARIRDKIGISYDEYSQPIASNEIARMLTCAFCTSVYVGIVVAAIQNAGNTLPVQKALSLGLVYSAVTCIIELFKPKG